ncbi:MULTISPECIES: ArsR/SmtB family transcription factor [unclassified Streptomyces]|uniref:ArsR/SmtB family transcription factor n=2 Tax=unclassified Streptomyces TaxID=2593676 RepID=UPI002DDA33AD|nr:MULTISPECIES: metalloregulator ArsR/SmtB family transcription factor [unclassified Streptomyces]
MVVAASNLRISPVGQGSCSPGPSGDLITRDEVELRVAGLKAMADPARLQILHLIQQAPAGELCVCDLTDSLGLSQPAVSRHLKILAMAGLLAREQRGTWAWFSLVPSALRDLQDRVFGSLVPH